MLLNKLSNENDITAVLEGTANGTMDRKTQKKTYTKIFLKSAAQGAIVSFAAIGVLAVIVTALVTADIDGVIEE